MAEEAEQKKDKRIKNLLHKAPQTLKDFFNAVKKEDSGDKLQQLKDAIDRVKKGDWSEVEAMKEQRVTQSRRTMFFFECTSILDA